jgi:hypothetical protein
VIQINDGLGFGEGSVSGEGAPAVLDTAKEAISSQSILVAVDRDEKGHILEDDGCGDGRGVKKIFRLHKQLKRSLHRAKVFGGAAAMTAAGLVGTGRAEGWSVEETFGTAIEKLDERDMDFGAHTDDQATGENCGCGAIDKAPEIMHAAITYEPQIRETLGVLGVKTDELNRVYANYHDYIEALPDEKYSGKRVMEKIVGAGKVVKQLAGKHLEKFIVLNSVRDHTVDQGLVRQQTGGKADVFAVDLWRLQDIAAGLCPQDDRDEAQVFLSELVYTLATAAVLTKGDLPVYLIQQS